MKLILLLLVWAASYLSVSAQISENPSKVYRSNIKTVELRKPQDPFAPPVVVLGAGTSQLTCSFDDLTGSIHRFAYTAVLCNADWSTSRLWPNEYFSGLNEDRIVDAKPSFNTRVAYTHYSFQFPSANMQLTKSGNYLLKVYEENKPDNLCFTIRFYVTENVASVTGTVSKSSIPEQRNSHQDVDFLVNTNTNLVAPRSNVYATILQNGRDDNAIRLRPKQVIGSTIDFNFDNGENTFAAGNEFRRFNLSSVRTAMDHVSEVAVIADTCSALLMADKPRAFGSYLSENDINGNFLPNNIDYQNTETESEYVKVKFFLKLSRALSKGKILVSGRFCQWDPMAGFEMKYNPTLSGFVGEGLLKQGYYDYLYLYFPEENKPGLTGLAEGDYSETQNEYQIYVYYHKPGEVYDRLIGTGVFGQTKAN